MYNFNSILFNNFLSIHLTLFVQALLYTKICNFDFFPLFTSYYTIINSVLFYPFCDTDSYTTSYKLDNILSNMSFDQHPHTFTFPDLSNGIGFLYINTHTPFLPSPTPLHLSISNSIYLSASLGLYKSLFPPQLMLTNAVGRQGLFWMSLLLHTICVTHCHNHPSAMTSLNLKRTYEKTPDEDFNVYGSGPKGCHIPTIRGDYDSSHRVP